MIQLQTSQGYTLISGSTGIGKTDLIHEYAASHCKNIFWINAENEMTILNGFWTILEKQHSGDFAKPIIKVLDQFANSQRDGLLVFDDIKSLDFVRNLFPIYDLRRSTIRIVFILQQDVLDAAENVLCLQRFTSEDANLYVRKWLTVLHNDQDVEYVHNLITALHFHPFALQQAVRHILARSPNWPSTAQAIPLYLAEFGKLQNCSGGDAISKVPTTTAILSLDWLKRSEPNWNVLNYVLELLAYFGSTPFELMEFVPHLTEYGRIEVHSAVIKLNQYGLIRGKNVICIPTLIRNIILERSNEQKVLRQCLQILNKCSDITVVTKSILNFIFVWEQCAHHEQLVREFHELPNKILCVLIKSGRIAQADAFGKFCGNVLETVLGAEHLSAIKVLSKRAEVAYMLQNYAEAQRGYERVLWQRTLQLNEDHPSTIKAQYSLAAVLYKSGQLSAALQMYEHLLERITRLKEEHPDRERNLIIIRKIRQLIEKNNATAESTDDEHYTLDTVIGYQRKGKYQEGIIACRSIIKRTKNNISKQYDYLLATRRLAKLFHLQGNYEEALEANRELLVVGEKILGENHTDNLIPKRRIANIQQAQGHIEMASKSYADLLAESLTLLGPDHPDHLQIRREQAYFLRNMGKLPEALHAYSQILNDGELALGHDHPTNLITKRCVASVWQQMGAIDTAEQLYAEVLDKGQLILGNDHCDHLIAKRAMATIRFQQGRTDEALEMFANVLLKGIEWFGKDHPDNELTRQAMLAAMQQTIVPPARCGTEISSSDDASINERNNEVPATENLITKCCIAAVLQDQGEYDAALSAYQEVLDRREQELGSDHPDNLITRRAMAAVLQKQGKYDEAIREYREILERGEKILGPDHVDNSMLKRHIAAVQRQKMKFNNFLTAFHAERVRANKFNTGFLVMLLSLIISLLVIYSQPN